MLPQEYINNTNPFAHVRSYTEGTGPDVDKRAKLEAIHQLQPKFVPLGIDQAILSKEFIEKSEVAIKKGIASLLGRGMAMVQGSPEEDPESVLRRNAETPGVTDILIDISRLRLLHKQRKLREKVFLALQSMISPERIGAIDLSFRVPEDCLADAMEYELLERRHAARKESQKEAEIEHRDRAEDD
jgi:hypothetical protein